MSARRKGLLREGALKRGNERLVLDLRRREGGGGEQTKSSLTGASISFRESCSPGLNLIGSERGGGGSCGLSMRFCRVGQGGEMVWRRGRP